MDIDTQKAFFVEEVGLFFDQAGVPRMAGRILGWLLICDPPHQSINELMEVLQASKGSISTMTRLLIQLELVERVSLPGARRDYFRLTSTSWTQLVHGRLFQITALRQLAERGLTLLDEQATESRQRLEEMHDLYAFFERELPLLLERWQQERAARKE